MMRAVAGPGIAPQSTNDDRDMAKVEAKIADAIEAGARRPPHPLDTDTELGRSLHQEAVGRCTSDNSHPSTSRASLPPRSLDENV